MIFKTIANLKKHYNNFLRHFNLKFEYIYFRTNSRNFSKIQRKKIILHFEESRKLFIQYFPDNLKKKSQNIK